jgi:hypothetical protein
MPVKAGIHARALARLSPPGFRVRGNDGFALRSAETGSSIVTSGLMEATSDK